MSNKVVIIGPYGVGKTSLVNRKKYRDYETPAFTVGAAFTRVNCSNGEKNVTLEVWDTAGQERYNSLVKLFLRNAAVVVMCFEDSSLDDVLDFVNLHKSQIPEETVTLLVETKCDLEKKNNMMKIFSSIGYPIYRTSAKTGEGVGELFHMIAGNTTPPIKRIIHRRKVWSCAC